MTHEKCEIQPKNTAIEIAKMWFKFDKNHKISTQFFKYVGIGFCIFCAGAGFPLALYFIENYLRK